MNVLALEPYFGGSHKAFLDGWQARSAHTWTTLTLPPYKWKWRMRHAAVTFADQIRDRWAKGERWDLLFCSDMLNLAELLGLLPPQVRDLPRVVYFHENQLTYPVRHASERDYQFVFTNVTTALAATRVWFNSAYHRDTLLEALPGFFRKMPDHQPLDVAQRIRDKSAVFSPGVRDFPPRSTRDPGPLRILWAARWEHDKNPDALFGAVRALQSEGIAFRLSVIGERFREHPAVFDSARTEFRDCIDRWGFQERVADYDAALREADVMVSTADHEFFGISVIEAVAAGAFPLVPRRLAYPEVLGPLESLDVGPIFYDGSPTDLAEKLKTLADRLRLGDLWQGDPRRGVVVVSRYAWRHVAPRLDEAIEAVVGADT